MTDMPSRTRSSIVYVFTTALLWLFALPVALIAEEGAGVRWRATLAVGVAVLVAGAGLALVDRGAAALSSAGIGLFSVVPGSRLVVDGLYGRMRNPIDVGVIALALAPWIAVDLRLMWLVPAGAIVWLVGAVGPYEDRRLFERFGDEFVAYRSRVPKWLPRV